MKLCLLVFLMMPVVVLWGGPIGYFEQISPTPTSYVQGVDFDTFLGSLYGSAGGPVEVVDNLGCSSADFSGFAPGAIAIIMRGTCTFTQKGMNAEAAGAAGFIVVNNVAGIVNGMYSGGVPAIPGVAVTKSLGLTLTQTNNLEVRLGVVPEPATWLFAAFGFGLLPLLRRR